jgi:stage II sporulation protein D
VNLTPSPQSTLRLAVRGPYLVRPLNSEQTLAEGLVLAQTLVTSGAHGVKLGASTWPQEVVEVVPTGAGLVVVNDRAYHGLVRIYREGSGKLTAVNVLPLEQYVSCVIDAEMPAKFPPAAREAQAIVARSYALWQMQQAPRDARFDVFATVRSQHYLGVEYVDGNGRRLAGESAASRQAAAATRGKVCQTGGRLFCTYYSAVCGGATTPGRELFDDADPVLRSVPCHWCRDSDKYRWTTELTIDELLTGIRKSAKGLELTGVTSIRQLAGPQPGTIAKWEISDGRRRATVDAVSLRQNLPAGRLLSPHCSLRLDRGKILAEGSGHGHGAGLCQWGARGQAQAGRSAEEIVRYYYPGVVVADWGY